MAIVPLPLPAGAEARTLLQYLLEHGDLLGRDRAGRIVIQLMVDDWTLEGLMTFDADVADLEDSDDEPDDDAEEDGPPAVLLEVVPPKVMRSDAETSATVPRQRVPPPDRRALGGRLTLCWGVSAPTVTGAVPSETVAHQLGGDVLAVEVA